MAGLNLSHTMDEAEERRKSQSFVSAGIVISVVVMVLTGAIFGGVRLYSASIDKEIAQVDATLAASAEQIKGERVDRVADFDARVAFFAERAGDIVDPQNILTTLESVMVPGVVLTRYEYKHDSQTSLIEGQVDDFKKLAEQMLRLKSEMMFARVTLEQVNRNEDGRILFAFHASF